MASTYLKKMEEELLEQMRQEIADTSSAYQSSITSLNRSRPERKTLAETALPGGVLGGLAGAMISGPAALIMGLGGMAAKHLMTTSSEKGQNEDIDSQIRELQRQEEEVCRAVEEKYMDMIRDEKNRYLTAVKTARVSYGSSRAMSPLTKWLADRFENEIRAADRRALQKVIKAEFAFGVTEAGLHTLRWENGSYKTVERFDFSANGFCRLPDFEDQVGFSQACAKLVRFEIVSRFPRDPVAPSGARPQLSVFSDDELTELHYQVANPAC